jgi:prepilin-type N-terminal cleavage/methylation domain-containing protein
MRMIRRNTHGFTLIEIIATLVIVGVIVTIAGMGVGLVLDGYFFARDTSKTATNVQAVLSRLEKEFTVIKEVSFSTSTSITFDGYGKDGLPSSKYTLSWSANIGDLILTNKNKSPSEDNILLKNVTSFFLSFYDSNGNKRPSWDNDCKIIEITLKVNVSQKIDKEFVVRIRPRNL